MKTKMMRLIIAAMLTTFAFPMVAVADTYWDDPNPPTLMSASIDRTTVGIGEAVTISWDVEDIDGVEGSSPLIESPDGGTFSLTSYSSGEGGTYVSEFRVNSSTEPGEYRIKAFDVSDKRGYETTITEGVPNLVFTVESSAPDANPPKIVSASIDRTTVTVGGKIVITYEAKDADGIQYCSPCIETPDGNHIYIANTQNNDGGPFSAEFEINSTTPLGVYRVSSFEVTDKKGYVTVVDEGFPALTFTVEESAPDSNPPSVSNVKIERSVVSVGDVVKISWIAEDPDGVRGSSPCIETPAGNHFYIATSQMNNSPIFTAEYRVTSSTEPGKYRITSIEVTDSKGFVTEVTEGLSDISFTVVDPDDVPSYKIIEGNNAKYSAGSKEGLRFRFDGPADRFMLLEVDGSVVDMDSYTVESGSTIVTLSPSYLDGLEAGEHTATAYYNDGGRASATFEVAAKSDDSTGADKETDKTNSSEDSGKKDSGKKAGEKNEPVGNLAQTGDMLPLQLTLLAVLSASTMVIATARRHCLEDWE